MMEKIAIQAFELCHISKIHMPVIQIPSLVSGISRLAQIA